MTKDKDVIITKVIIEWLIYTENSMYNMNPVNMYKAYVVTTPVFNFAILLLRLNSPFSNP